MSGIESIRNAKDFGYNEQERYHEHIAKLESNARGHMEPEAFQRYCALKTVHQDHAIQTLVMINQAIMQGKVTGRISDAQFKDILERIAPKRQDFRIVRK